METTERERKPSAAPPFMLLAMLLAIPGAALVVSAFPRQDVVLGLIGLTLVSVAGLLARGVFVVAPNESMVLVLFGTYKGTVRQNGFH